MTWITNGTATLTNGSAIVTGNGTTWLNRVGISDVFIAPNGVLYEVASIQSGTQLTLATPYVGATIANTSYKIFPTQAYNLKVAIAANDLVASFQPTLDALTAQLTSDVFNGRFAAGTVAAPGVSFTAAPGTGLSAVGTNVLVASTGGTEALRISSTQNVGIGVTPVNRLDISHNTTLQAIAQITNANAGTNADARFVVSNGTVTGGLLMRGTGFTSVANNLLLYVGGNNPIGFSTNGLTRATIAGDGTTTFNNQLVAVTDVNFGGNVILSRGGGTSIVRSDVVGYLGISGGNALSVGSNILLGGTTTSPFAGVTVFRNNAVESMRIANDGKVGIGTTTGTAKLEVRSDGASTQNILTIRNNNPTVGSTRSRLGFGVYRDVDANVLGASIDCLNELGSTNGSLAHGGTLVFNTTIDGGQALTEKARLTAGGNFGVGGIPLARMHAIGGSMAQTNSVDGTDGIIQYNAAGTRVGSMYGAGTSYYRMQSDTGVARLSLNSVSGYLSFETAGVERARIAANGFAGFGVANPILPTHIAAGYSAGNVANVLLISQNSGADPNTGQGVRVHLAANNSTDRSATIESRVTNGINGHTLSFGTNLPGASSTEKMRIDTIGNVTIGGTAVTRAIEVAGSGTAGATNALNIETATSGSYSGVTIVRNDGTSAVLGPTINLARTRGASIDSVVSVVDGDTLGGIAWSGADGTDIRTKAAEIVTQVDGTAGPSVIPGRIVFSTTAAGAAVPTERARITALGRLGIGTTTPLARFDVSSGMDAGAIVIGANVSSQARSDATTKVGRIAAVHYTNAELPFGIISGASNSTDNIVEVGGNSSAQNCATAIRFYTGPTRVGAALPTERMRITSTGLVGIGTGPTVDPAVDLEVSKVGTAAATSFRVTNQTDSGYGQVQYIGSTFATVDRRNNMELVTIGATSDIAVLPNGTERARFTAAGHTLFGTKVAQAPLILAGPASLTHQVSGTSGVSSGYLATRFAGVTAASAPAYAFARSRGATEGSMTSVASGDTLGYLSWTGADGTTFQESARIVGQVDATPGTNIMPGRLVFYTSPTTSATPAERMRIDSNGNIGLGITSNINRRLVMGSDTSSQEYIVVRTAAAGTSGVLFNDDGGTINQGAIIYEHATDALTLRSSGSERARLNSSGQLLVGTSTSVGNGGILQLSSGITFPSTQVASTDANTLDDYKEGTFSPVISGTTSAGAGTYSTSTGFYTKIGRLVHFSIRLTWSAHTGTGNITITGMPFTSNPSAGVQTVAIGAQNLTFAGQLVAYVVASSTSITLAQVVSNALISGVPMDAAGDIWVAGCYPL